MKKLNTSTIISIAFIAGILIMVNVIGIRYFLRADLTSSKMYSLSKASRDIVANVEDQVLVKAYFSRNIPGQYGRVERYLRDMLADYKAYSHGHFDYEFIDPGSEEKLEEEAQSFNIPPMQARSMASDKMEIVKIYMGLVFIYGDRRETIPVVTSSANLEYEITSLIHRLTTIRKPILGIASTGTAEQSASLQNLHEQFVRMYDMRSIDLNETIDSAIDGVLVLAPRQPFTEWQLFNLDQYIINGGKVGMFMSSYIADLQRSMQIMLNNLNVSEFLNNYGIGLGEDVLIDANAAMVTMQRKEGLFNISMPVRLYYLPSINNFNSENVITRELQQVQTYFPSSVDTTLAREKGFEIEGLMYTSEVSGRKTGRVLMMDPSTPMTKDDFNDKHIPIAAIVKGRFTSYFKESGPPKKPGGEEGEEEDYNGPFITDAESENRLLLVGDGFMALDQYAQNPQDLVFIQNTADWLLQSEDLITIRSKQIPMRPLRWMEGDIPQVVISLTKWGNRFGPVIIVIIFGIVLWQIRRVRNKALMASK
ncbi:MAG: GldG family protein [Candidatus Latescibacteria bacterium]|jgi:gliding-associated putative ABC transporter substrate-binding component GldG|nr:GldG family protein [Candidatus Latescibacterota bacterium]